MKIFAVSGSPRKSKGITDRILRPFLEGAREAGAEVDLVYLQGKKLKPCLGCFNCWFKTPGECAQKDDMAELLPRLDAADTLVLATPLYVCGMSAQLKLFLDRFIPIVEPFIVMVDGHCSHPRRSGGKLAGMVLVSSCGFHELDNFDALVAQVKAICALGGSKFYGALLRPHGEILPLAEQTMKEKTDAVYAAAREAGRRMVLEDEIPGELLAEVSKELMPREVYVEGANRYFQSMLDKAKAKSA